MQSNLYLRTDPIPCGHEICWNTKESVCQGISVRNTTDKSVQGQGIGWTAGEALTTGARGFLSVFYFLKLKKKEKKTKKRKNGLKRWTAWTERFFFTWPVLRWWPLEHMLTKKSISVMFLLSGLFLVFCLLKSRMRGPRVSSDLLSVS